MQSLQIALSCCFKSSSTRHKKKFLQEKKINCWQWAISCFIWLSLFLFLLFSSHFIVCHKWRSTKQTSSTENKLLWTFFFGAHIFFLTLRKGKIIIASNLFNCKEIMLHNVFFCQWPCWVEFLWASWRFWKWNYGN